MIKYAVISLLLGATATSAYVIDVRSPDYSPSPRTAVRSGSIYATGIVEGATPDVQLFPEISGRVVEILVAIGDQVDPNDVLLRLDDKHQRQLVASSQASLELAQAQLDRLVNGARSSERAEARALYEGRRARLEQAKRSWSRVEQLHRQAAVSQQEADDQRSVVESLVAEVNAAQARLEQLEAPARSDELRAAQAKVAAAQSEFELARIGLDKCTLKAPSRGRIIDLQVERGELLGPDSAAAAIVLSDTSKMRIRAYVEEIDAPGIAVGMPARITADGLPEHEAIGKVTFMSPRMTPKLLSNGKSNELYDTKVREVLIDVADPSRLILGLRVDVLLRDGDSAAGVPEKSFVADEFPPKQEKGDFQEGLE